MSSHAVQEVGTEVGTEAGTEEGTEVGTEEGTEFQNSVTVTSAPGSTELWSAGISM